MRYFLAVIAFELGLATLIFSAAGRLDLPWAWALLATHATLLSISAWAIDPSLRRERTRRRPGGIDRLFRSLILLFLVIHLVVAVLDAGRFGWSPPVPDAARAVALLLYAAGVLLSVRAMTVNRFFAPAVRLQPERGQYPVTAGPYRFVRHPGYADYAASVRYRLVPCVW